MTGNGGIVGGFILAAARMAGHQVTTLDRASGWSLGDRPDLHGHDALVHCAFAHLPGRYRGGEGDDPAGFRRTNLDGTIRLFDAAAQDGVTRIVFLSSRAVHDGHPAGLALSDDMPPRPTSLYGEVKALAEEHLTGLPLRGTALRATGVYGPGRANKWRGLFADFRAGKTPAPHVATEVHGIDLAAAALTVLASPAPPMTANVSDLVLDRHDLLAEIARLTGCVTPLPPRADSLTLRVPQCDVLAALGWRPGGIARLRSTLPGLLEP